MSQENLQTTIMQKFFEGGGGGGVKKVYYGIVQVVNRPFPNSPWSLFQSESKCEIFVIVISSNFNIKENWYS